jgi:hypothetical protein
MNYFKYFENEKHLMFEKYSDLISLIINHKIIVVSFSSFFSHSSN